MLHLGLVVASMMVRWRLLPTLAPLAGVARALAGALLPFGTDRGGMMVEASGVDGDGDRVTGRWTLVAERGEGPSVPVFPALAVLRALAGSRGLPVGGHVCAGLLNLDAIAREWAGRSIAVARSRAERGAGLFPDALGAEFPTLPAAVAALHRSGAAEVWHGRADVEGGDTWFARLIARMFGLPRTARDVAVTVTIEASDGAERWTRNFGGQAFGSVLRPQPGASAVEERFGPIRFTLGLVADASGLRMRVSGWRLGPIPMPRVLAIRSDARESVDAAGRFRFDVPIDLPLGFGRVVRYAGWLVPQGVQTRTAGRYPAIQADIGGGGSEY